MTRLTHRMQAARVLSAAELALLPVVIVVLAATRLALTRVGYRRTLSRLSATLPAPGPRPDLSRARSVARVTDVAATLLPGPYRCLPRSLTVWSLLRLRHSPCELRLGVRRSEPGGLEAHAWVECDGVAVTDDEQATVSFAAFSSAMET